MKVLISGCGRVGGFVAGLLDSEGHDVTIIDIDKGAFVHLPDDFKGTTHLGNGVDLDVLRELGIDRADAFLALTQGDNRNLMAAQIAKEIFRVKTAVAKVNDPIRAQIYREKGIVTFSRTTILGLLVHAMLMNESEVGEVLLERTLETERALARSEAQGTARGDAKGSAPSAVGARR
ncbi:MAG: potassium channel family protein [Candidatus Limnocylindria bacterium]